MTNLQIFIISACVYIILACLFFRAIARAQPLQTRDGCTEDATDGTAPATEPVLAARHSSVDADSPPVALKLPVADGSDQVVTCKRVLKIVSCTDPMLWYFHMIGEEVPYLGEWKVEGAYKSREPAGYVNMVYFKDARVIIKESV